MIQDVLAEDLGIFEARELIEHHFESSYKNSQDQVVDYIWLSFLIILISI